MISRNNDNILCCGTIPLTEVAAAFGTPTYVYDYDTLLQTITTYKAAFTSRPTRLCYAVKANPSLALLKLLAEQEFSFDIVSGGELARLQHLNVPGNRIVFSGVGKTAKEINAALEYNILCFNCESIAELERLNLLAEQQGKLATIALRINPNVPTKNHPFIATGHKASKFGLGGEGIIEAFTRLKSLPHLKLKGLSCHIGSQILEVDPFIEACTVMNEWATYAHEQGAELEWLDIGGGLGVTYVNEAPASIHEYAKSICETVSTRYALIIEPGRSLIASAGLLLTQVEYLKSQNEQHFCIVDAGMNDLMRPSLYQAIHTIAPVIPRPKEKTKAWNVVGPICESSDFFARDLELALEAQDYLAIMTTGAYGASMSSQYNTRGLPAEVLIKNKTLHAIRTREPLEEIFRNEHPLK